MLLFKYMGFIFSFVSFHGIQFYITEIPPYLYISGITGSQVISSILPKYTLCCVSAPHPDTHCVFTHEWLIFSADYVMSQQLRREFVPAQCLLRLREDVMRLILSILYKVLAAASSSIQLQFTQFLSLTGSYGLRICCRKAAEGNINLLCCWLTLLCANEGVHT